MEVLTKASDKRTILFATHEGDAASELKRQLGQIFNLTVCSSADEALDILNERFNALSAAVVDVALAAKDNCAFMKAFAAERAFDTIPVIITTIGMPDGPCIRCLDEGAVDVLELPCATQVLHHRIENAIQLKRSSTFYEIESMLHVLPSMIFLKDAEGRYVFSTQYWHHLETGGDPKWTIRGKTDVDIRKDKENAVKAMEADQEIIRTGKGTSYVIQIDADGVTDFIQLIKEPVFDENGNVTGIIALGNDVTEQELMKRKLERYALIDELTGTGNRRAFNEFVKSIPSRDDFPIAVISADCDCLKKVNDTLGHLVGDEYIHMAALVMQGSVPDMELVFRTGGDEFVAFVPHATAEQAQELVANMKRKAELFKLHIDEAVVSYGIACIDGPDSDIDGIIATADKRMYAEKASHKR